MARPFFSFCVQTTKQSGHQTFVILKDPSNKKILSYPNTFEFLIKHIPMPKYSNRTGIQIIKVDNQGLEN